MKTEGVEAIFLTTHNWGRSAKFFQSLGYTLDFETDHNSGQLRNGPPLPLHRRSARRPGASHAAGDESRRCPRSSWTPASKSSPLPGHPLGHAGDDGARSRRPCLEPAGAQVKAERPPCRTAKPSAQTARPNAPRCGAPCICKPMRRPMSSRTTSACGCWPCRTAGASARHGSGLHPDLPRVMVARARFVEDLVLEQAAQGVAQYVILGAGLDSFAQRRPDIASRMRVRSGPARAAGMEAPATGRAGLRRAGMAATGPGGLRGRRFRLASAGRGGLRCDAPGIRRVHGRQHVSDPGRDAGHVSTGGRARARLHARHDAHASGGTDGARGPARHRNGRQGRPRQRDTVHQLLCAGPDHGDGAGGGFRDVRHVAPAVLAQRYFSGERMA